MKNTMHTNDANQSVNAELEKKIEAFMSAGDCGNAYFWITQSVIVNGTDRELNEVIRLLFGEAYMVPTGTGIQDSYFTEGENWTFALYCDGVESQIEITAHWDVLDSLTVKLEAQGLTSLDCLEDPRWQEESA